MHICIIGDGVAGLMAANAFATKNYITKVTHIGSSKMPSIGVGESTTLNFSSLQKSFIPDEIEFIQESDACVKVGVLYSNWAEKEFIHHYRVPYVYEKYGTNPIEYANTLANKNKDVYIHDILATRLYYDAKQYKIPYPLDNPNSPNCYYGTSWHFDAGKYIQYLKKLLSKNQNTTMIDDIVVDCKFNEDETIDTIILESNQTIKADYYIIATGKIEQSSKIFKIKYKDMSNVLLNNRALFYPKPYVNKAKEIHPYTIAKTMKNGWRWITPTWSRVGTGYVFSSNHITVDQAIQEFQEDIGDDTVIPNVVDFTPRCNTSTFNSNYMTIGMAQGFLEPLDAPGLAVSSALIMMLDTVFSKNEYDIQIDRMNEFVRSLYEGWAAFVLSQYKTCYRTDTQYWIDHKEIEFDYFTYLKNNMYNDTSFVDYYDDVESIVNEVRRDIIVMLQQTTASKNIQWKSKTNLIPFKLDDSQHQSFDHYTFLKVIHGEL